MTITSPAFTHNASVSSKYTCDGENINPPLVFSDIPAGAKSLVLIVDDPDAPSKTWTHWIVCNIPPNTSEIKENSTPKGEQVATGFGKAGYGGPCPPSGSHRYFFKLYALDETLDDLPEFADKSMVEEAMEGHVLGKAELIGVYNRSH